MSKRSFINWLITSLIILLTSLIAVFYQQKKQIQYSFNLYINKTKGFEIELDNFKYLIDLPYCAKYKKLEDVELMSIQKIKLKLSDIVSKDQVWYYYDFQKSCQTCTIETISKLNKLATEIGPNHINIVSNMIDFRDLAILSSKLSDHVSCYMTNTDITEFNYDLNVVYQFITLVNEDLEILSFLPLGSQRVFNQIHYNYFKSYFKYNNN